MKTSSVGILIGLMCLGAHAEDEPNPNGATTRFDMKKHGFAFGNWYQGTITLDIPLVGKVDVGHAKGYGLCGGMTYAALDTFFLDGAAPPAPGDPSKPPESDTPLRSSIYARQMDSLKADDWFLVRRLLSWILKPIDSNYLTTGLRVLSDRQFKHNIVPEINAGRPVPLCLVKADVDDFIPNGAAITPEGFTKNHQVLAVGYQFHRRSGTEDEWDIVIYDPNYPGEPQVLHMLARTQTALDKTEVLQRFRGLYATPYKPERPYWIPESASVQQRIAGFKTPVPAASPAMEESYTVLSINAESGGVVADDGAGAKVEFTVPPVVAKELRVGQRVAPDPDAQTVTLSLSVPATFAAAPAPEEPSAAGVPSGEDENDGNDSDPASRTPLLRGRRPPPRTDGTPSRGVRLKDYEKAKAIVDKVAALFANREIDISLIAGNKYMVNDCLGIKASAGGFRLRFENPEIRFEDSGIVFAFKIDRIAFDALSVRIRPNVTNPSKLCHFSKAFGVGGSASDVRLEIRIDPLLDLERCHVYDMRPIHVFVRIGNLNLKPLQNDLDKVAKNMIEDALTNFLDGALFGGAPLGPQQIIQTIDDVLEIDCPGKRGGIAKGAKGAKEAAGAVKAQSAPATAAPGAGPGFSLEPNAELKGRMGRLIVSFSEEEQPAGTPVALFRPGNPKEIKSGYGRVTYDLLPGAYVVAVCKKAIDGVTIQPGHDTILHLGVLRIRAEAGTHIAILDADQKTELHDGYGKMSVGLPVGTYYVKVQDQLEPVTIERGKITEF